MGHSDLSIDNARKMNIDLLDLDFVVHSNSHLDHTWGLASLVRLFTEAKIEGTYRKSPSLVAHPDLLLPRWVEGLGETGSFLFLAELSRPFELTLSREPLWLPERLVFLGEILREDDFEAGSPLGRISASSGRRTTL